MNDDAFAVLGTTHKISARARDAQKLRPFQSYLFAEEMIDVAREAGEYNNIAM